MPLYIFTKNLNYKKNEHHKILKLYRYHEKYFYKSKKITHGFFFPLLEKKKKNTFQYQKRTIKAVVFLVQGKTGS